MIYIRMTTTDDLPGIKALVHQFHAESIDSFGVFCNDEVLDKIMPVMVPTSMVLLDCNKVVGVIAGILTKHIQDDKKLFQETIWFVLKKYRRDGIKLLNAMEAHCKSIGCVHMVMANMGAERVDVFQKFYESHGYTLLDVQYIKAL